MPETMDTRLSRLRERAERALASGRRGGDVLTVLETMTREAPDGSAHALFAHRHLAELQLSGSPWRAALHLRRLVQAGAADDSAHALMGLSQALLGNYRMAVAAYRRAIKLAPRNPWYHHNLGHLLDVGLSDSVAALEHLRMAHRIQPEEDEIAASLAHCLARLGQLKEAQLMAQRAVRRSPRNREHAALLEWIKSGAPSNVVPSARVDSQTSSSSSNRVHRRSNRSPLDVETAHTRASDSPRVEAAATGQANAGQASAAQAPNAQSRPDRDKQKRPIPETREPKESRDLRAAKEPNNPSLRPARPALKAAAPIPASKPSHTSHPSPTSVLGGRGRNDQVGLRDRDDRHEQNDQLDPDHHLDRDRDQDLDEDQQSDGELTPALGRVLSMLEAYGEAPGISHNSSHNSSTSGSHSVHDAQHAAEYLKLARSLWVDFCARRQPRVQKPAVYAAAVEYTLSKLAGRSLTQAQLARRYSVTARAIAARYEEICEALALEPGDPRYVVSSAQ
jgi:tetratricopeptide (TPR) repeat protein